MGFLDRLLGREKKPAESAPAAPVSGPSDHTHDHDHDHDHDHAHDEETAQGENQPPA